VRFKLFPLEPLDPGILESLLQQTATLDASQMALKKRYLRKKNKQMAKPGNNIWRELGPFIRLFLPHGRWMVLGVTLGFIAVGAVIGLLSLAGWFLTATAIAGLTAAGAHGFNFFFPSIGVRVFAFARTLARYGERIVCHDATFRILQSFRVWFYRHLEPLAPACFARYRSGDILNRLVEDIDTLDNLYLRVLSPGAVALLISLVLLALLWVFDAAMALTTLVFLGTAGLAVPLLAQKMGADTGRKLARQSAGLRSRIVEGLQGMPELLVYGAVPVHLDAVRRDTGKLTASQRRMSHLTGLSGVLVTMISGLAVLTILFLGVGLLETGDLNGANLALVALAVMASFEALLPLPVAFQYLGRTREAGKRLMEIVETRPAAVFPEQSAVQPNDYSLTFDNVSFRYVDGAPLSLDRVNFHVAQGRRGVILGETGSGKSTLVNLLARFWTPESGSILMGGGNISDLSEPDLRRHISVVSQQAHLFNASLRDNLRIAARPDATDSDLYAALDAAQLLAFVKGLPDGLDTWVGEAGNRLSGGQAKRVAVARAFLHDAPIWVLDEPTEGLDRVTAHGLMQSIYDRTEGKTMLLITHRHVDFEKIGRVIALEAGRIATPDTYQ